MPAAPSRPCARPSALCFETWDAASHACRCALQNSDSSLGGDRLGSLSTRGGSLPRAPSNLARVSLTEVMGRVGPSAARASPVRCGLCAPLDAAPAWLPGAAVVQGFCSRGCPARGENSEA